MAASTQISLGEYLQTTYRPDREYIDGELREKSMGKYEHSRIQALLAAWFIKNEGLWRAIALTVFHRPRVLSGATVRLACRN